LLLLVGAGAAVRAVLAAIAVAIAVGTILAAVFRATGGFRRAIAASDFRRVGGRAGKSGCEETCGDGGAAE
jgi:hypothetical protein